MSSMMMIFGGLLFFGGIFTALAMESGVAFLLSVVGALLFVLAGPQKKREREERMHNESLAK